MTFSKPSWDSRERHDELIALLLTGRWPLAELQDRLEVAPTEEEKEEAGKYGHVAGVTYLIQMARRNGWPVVVLDINHESWVFLPQDVIDEDLTNEG